MLYLLVSFRNCKGSCKFELMLLSTTPLGIGVMQYISENAITLKKSIFSIGINNMLELSTSYDCLTKQ